MALRLIEMVLSQKSAEEVRDFLKVHKVFEYSQAILSNDQILVKILLDVEQLDQVLEFFEKRYSDWHADRAVILPVVAAWPRIMTGSDIRPANASEWIGREEMYEDIKSAAQCSKVYLAMLVFSTIVATAGLYNNNVAIIIGAMVIAPMLGPSVALALGTTLGDVTLLWHALRTGLIGIITTVIVSLIIGILVQVDPTIHEVALRTRVGIGDIAVALAAGGAGALAFSTGLSAILIGVMVAVALLPPLVTFGMLIGSNHIISATGALSLFFMNLICINLSAVVTFIVLGIHPTSWFEAERASKSKRILISILVMMLALLAMLILFLQK